MRFIKLTEVKRLQTRNLKMQVTNTRKVYKERYFNVDKIENFSRLEDTTYLYMSTSSAAYEVVETPEEIIELIKNTEEI
ncbi:hypothetical protein CIRMBP1233_00086 [Enterococcus cecorum]|nr:hypothetical protein CIRMBP1233_00086 [Enterococcus cecorum]CAI3262239.1 hypothetical protein CIRMBP1215_00137 [Enterococcus cecorum]CAI3291447.1 hypothetical protein CIRMBP1217_00460 [Enterococcus cecorum]CAI3294989.1 hypothetical protein CIRMBP1219_00597 [Enterococcus cecorum]CAI3484299.1 hypothetical protein CIRMBP1216_02323 [Enterococcus cecorum]